ncbi:unnamed protein product [Allacma fusca]|uniref:Uncharacterized protein n=1 Tax=Allacma fusca TaxID=39272 RepID=A0A8J2Q1U8_9HEXA|nr:unnamed protein product [Allacma fusca]
MLRFRDIQYQGIDISVALNAAILLYAGIHGLPLKNPEEASKVLTTGSFVIMFIALGLHVYALWVVLAFVLEMRYARTHHYEQVRSLESISSQRRKSRSPVFRIPDDGE